MKIEKLKRLRELLFEALSLLEEDWRDALREECAKADNVNEVVDILRELSN